jgi:hypothetical protein
MLLSLSNAIIWGMSPAERMASPAVAGGTPTEAATNRSAAATSITLYIGSFLSNPGTFRAESWDHTLSRARLPDNPVVLTCPLKSLTWLILLATQSLCLGCYGLEPYVCILGSRRARREAASPDAGNEETRSDKEVSDRGLLTPTYMEALAHI